MAWIVGILLSGGVGTGVVALAGQSSASNAEAPSFSLTELGLRMFGEAAPAVLVVGVLLTAVMIGAAIVARDPGKEENGGDAP